MPPGTEGTAAMTRRPSSSSCASGRGDRSLKGGLIKGLLKNDGLAQLLKFRWVVSRRKDDGDAAGHQLVGQVVGPNTAKIDVKDGEIERFGRQESVRLVQAARQGRLVAEIGQHALDHHRNEAFVFDDEHAKSHDGVSAQGAVIVATTPLG
jgi:hypothetical protein